MLSCRSCPQLCRHVREVAECGGDVSLRSLKANPWAATSTVQRVFVGMYCMSGLPLYTPLCITQAGATMVLSRTTWPLSP
jgi:hypothetical protein